MQGDFQKVLRRLVQGVEDGCFPGAVLAVGYQGHLVFEAAVGHAMLTPMVRRMSLETVFDLASLTKAIATTTAVMCLVDMGELRLDAPVNTYIPVFGQALEVCPTLRQLLTHASGLPAWRPYYQSIDPAWPLTRRRHLVCEAVHRESLVSSPGTTTQYSDAGFILLGELVERVTDMPLDAFCAQQIFQPLGLQGMGFRDLAQPRPAGVEFASTEHCPWRGRVLDGEVHDENAWIMGGVAGHAGLFATARQVWLFAQSLIEACAGQPWLVSTVTLHAFTQRQGIPSDSSWALGWDTPTPGQSSAGRYMSPTAIGHLGFTGTSLWIDLAQRVVVVLLSNRVHPSRQREGLKAFRPAIHDAVMQALRLT
jgi:CubicO group peptidase (beta-lactamase class C family)